MSEEFKTKSITYNQAAIHVDRFLALRCAADLIAARVFPNGKEVSESMAAWWAVRKYVVPGRISEKDTNVSVVVVGDGTKPRTAALIAHMTKWSVYSVDPLLDLSSCQNIERLVMYRSKIETLRLDLYRFGHVIVVCVHSHATIENVMAGILFNKADFVSIPCCVHQPAPQNAGCVIEYEDPAIWSPKNKVVVSLDCPHPLEQADKLAERYCFNLTERWKERYDPDNPL